MSDVLIGALESHHERSSFSCGIESLDRYIREQASQDQRRNIARVFVATLGSSPVVVGYYSLSGTSIGLATLPASLVRRLPRYPHVPGVLIGRLAVDQMQKGRGLGALLLRDALRRIIAWQKEIGSWAVVVDAIDDAAAVFYRRFGFESFGDQPLKLFLPLDTVRKAMDA
jgi:GNAT superfamily N-acetyltransferase